MQLHIFTTQNNIAYEGEIQAINLPTEQGNKNLTEQRIPKVEKLVPGLIRITTRDGKTTTLSISKGIALITPAEIRITASTITSTPLQKLTELRSSQYVIELKLQNVKKKGNIEEINKLILELEKIKADIQLIELKS